MPDPLTLPPGEIHIWSAPLDQPTDMLADLAKYLSEDEHARAARYRFARDRAHFIAGRGILRHLLGCYLTMAPAALCFQYGEQGKPSLALEQGDAAHPLHFNLAHSYQSVIYAITRHQPLGIDIEQLRPLPDLAKLARRFFAPQECTVLFALPPEAQVSAFFACWTRKEAFLKAIGTGLATPLDSFEVTVHPDAPAQLLAIDGDAQQAAPWSLTSFAPVAGYIATLAVADHEYTTVMRSWLAMNGN